MYRTVELSMNLIDPWLWF